MSKRVTRKKSRSRSRKPTSKKLTSKPVRKPSRSRSRKRMPTQSIETATRSIKMAIPDDISFSAENPFGNAGGPCRCILAGGDIITIHEKTKDKVSRTEITQFLKLSFPAFNEKEYTQVTSKTFSKWVLAYIESELVGAMALFKKERYIMFGLLAVSPDHRKKGIATKLIEYIRKNYHKLKWTTTDAGLHKFYEKFGAKIVKSYSHSGKTFNMWEFT